ncbi:MAG: hypothetical protein U1E62_23630 [Alsobacter sp.]
MRPVAAAVLAAACMAAGLPRAFADDDLVLTFACEAETQASGVPAESLAWGRAFTVTVPFGEGESLALLDPETAKPRVTVHAADVLPGALRLPGEDAVLLWSRAMSRRAPLVGQAIRANGHVVALVLSRPRDASGDRTLTLFDSERAAAWNGLCREGPAR